MQILKIEDNHSDYKFDNQIILDKTSRFNRIKPQEFIFQLVKKNNTSELDQILEDAQSTKEQLRSSPKKQKDMALAKAAESINSNRKTLKLANYEDMEHASTLNLQESFIDRLKLDDKRIDSMISGLKKVIDLNDPVGETTKKSKSPSGFLVSKMRVPLGVIGIIYESRPNVTADASALCLKSGNACILRGGRLTRESYTVVKKSR